MIRSCKKDNCYYFKNPWNLIEIFNAIILIVLIITRFYSLLWISNYVLDGSDIEYVPLQKMVFMHDIERYTTGIISLLLWIKLFRYLSFMKRFQFIFELLTYAVTDLFFFLIMFFIFIIGMAQMAFLFFLQDVVGFRSFLISIVTLIKGVTGGLDSDALETSNRFFGPLYVVCFNIIVVIILINIFLAIINDAYDQIRKNREDESLHSLCQLCHVCNGNGGVTENISNEEHDEKRDM